MMTVFVLEKVFGSLQLVGQEQIIVKRLEKVEWIDPKDLSLENHGMVKDMFIKSFLNAYDQLSAQDLKIKQFTKEDWLNDNFEEETKDLLIQKSPIKLLAVKRDGAIIGAATVEQDKTEPSAFYVRQLALLPQYRGKGLGRLMMEAIEKEARDQKKTSIVLMVRILNTIGRGFYTHLGYEEGTYCHPEYSVENYIGYRKKLS